MAKCALGAWAAIDDESHWDKDIRVHLSNFVKLDKIRL